MADIKWSAYPSGGALVNSDIIVGLRNGLNYQFNAPTFDSQIVVVNTPTQAMVTKTIYIVNDPISLVTLTLPSVSAIGDQLAIIGQSADLWTIAQQSGQQIFISPQHTTLGTMGTLSSTGQYDSLVLICIAANTLWTTFGSPQTTGLTFV